VRYKIAVSYIRASRALAAFGSQCKGDYEYYWDEKAYERV